MINMLATHPKFKLDSSILTTILSFIQQGKHDIVNKLVNTQLCEMVKAIYRKMTSCDPIQQNHQ